MTSKPASKNNTKHLSLFIPKKMENYYYPNYTNVQRKLKNEWLNRRVEFLKLFWHALVKSFLTGFVSSPHTRIIQSLFLDILWSNKDNHNFQKVLQRSKSRYLIHPEAKKKRKKVLSDRLEFSRRI